MIEGGYDGHQITVLRTDIFVFYDGVNNMTLIILHRFVDEYAIQIDGDQDHLHEEGLEGGIVFKFGVQILTKIIQLRLVVQVLQHGETVVGEDDGDAFLELSEQVVGPHIA